MSEPVMLPLNEEMGAKLRKGTFSQLTFQSNDILSIQLLFGKSSFWQLLVGFPTKDKPKCLVYICCLCKCSLFFVIVKTDPACRQPSLCTIGQSFYTKLLTMLFKPNPSNAFSIQTILVARFILEKYWDALTILEDTNRKTFF